MTAFSSAQPGAQKLLRYTFIAEAPCIAPGWTRYLSTLDAGEAPSGSTLSTTPPGVSFDDTNIWVCPP